MSRGPPGARAAEQASVIVVGAGPAGASAAFQLARAGVEVLLVDRDGFPRSKTCGDGLTPAALAELERFGLRDEIAGSTNEVSGCVLFGPDGESFEAGSRWRGHVVRRERLDALLHGRALEAGARFRAGVHVARVERDADGLSLTDRGGTRYRCQLAILATGAHSGLPLDLGLQGRPPADAVARRAYFQSVRWDPSRLLFCYARDLLPGYGWVFPLGGGEANVGVGYFLQPGRRPELDRVWAQFESWLRGQGLFTGETRPTSPLATAQLRMGLRRNRLAGERILLAGDAAAAINPLSGEGISQALATGRLAAAAARAALERGDFSARSLRGYARAVRAELPRMRDYQLLKKLFESPALVDAAVGIARQRPRVATALYDTIIGAADPRATLARCAAGAASCGLERLRAAVRSD